MNCQMGAIKINVLVLYHVHNDTSEYSYCQNEGHFGETEYVRVI